jgi:hypothetical protein
MRLSLLRNLLLLDAAVLLVLGLLLIIAPKQVEVAFHFKELPPGVNYIIGVLGCVFATMAAGYFVAASNPIRHAIWIQIGIARGALECLLGLVYVARGVVTFSQAGLGIVVAAFIAAAYIALYPRPPRLAGSAGTPASAQSPRT